MTVNPESKKTVVLGASPNPARYSFQAVKKLKLNGHEVVAVGFRPGVIVDTFIKKDKPKIEDVHTISMYMGAERQAEYYDYIISLHPQRVIFNPGTYNESFMNTLIDKQIEVVDGCMLVMLDENSF